MLAASFSCAVAGAAPSSSADFKKEVIYQIITDRFFNGDPGNDDPQVSRGMFDRTHSNWQAYWGGDLEGIVKKLPYLAGMGITAVWISPPVDNINFPLDPPLKAPYHGYHARDFKQIDEHFGDSSNSWQAFDKLAKAAHRAGIKLIVDFAANHTSPQHSAEHGALYDSGVKLADIDNDPAGMFHHNPEISDLNDPYQVQNFTLFDLADLNQANPAVDRYLKDAATQLQDHGADAFRLDAIKHVDWAWLPGFADALRTHHDTFLFGEWMLMGTADPLYRSACQVANDSGIALLDYPLYTAINAVFGKDDRGMSELEATLSREKQDIRDSGSLVTFIDNHDLRRFLSLVSDRNRLHQALAFILTCRGIPCIYYGTEQYLHNDTDGGGDPYDRPLMQSFSETTPAYRLISKLSRLRQDNPALAYGSMVSRWSNDDVYVYERSYAGSSVLVAINKSAGKTYRLTGVACDLPPGNYADYLSGMLGGGSISVLRGGGAGVISRLSVRPRSVGVWAFTSCPF